MNPISSYWTLYTLYPSIIGKSLRNALAERLMQKIHLKLVTNLVTELMHSSIN